MRLFVSGSAPLLSETHERWRERTGHAILERYGMTETNMITSNPYDGDRRAGTVGFPAAGRQPAHRRSRHRRARSPHGEVGVIEVKGPNVFKGYWRMPEKTRERIPPRRLFHHRRSRQDRRARLCPYRRPRQGPHHLRRLQRLSQGDRERDRRDRRRRRKRRDRPAASRLRRRRHCGRRCREEAPRSTRRRSSRRSEGRLARYKAPKRVLFVDELPRNAMGKVQKAALREAYKDLYRGVTNCRGSAKCYACFPARPPRPEIPGARETDRAPPSARRRCRARGAPACDRTARRAGRRRWGRLS